MSRILITGSEGTLGLPLAAELEKRGHEVIGSDLMHTEKTNYMRTDIRDYRQVERLFEYARPEVIYNLSAEFGRSNGEAYYEQLWSTNQIGNENVIRMAEEFGTKFILAGSSEAYGESEEPWLMEHQLDRYKPNFHNNYALSKWVQEQQVFLAAKNKSVQAIVLRFFNAYGEGEFYSPFRSVCCLFVYRLMHGLPITVYKNYHRVFQHVDDWATTVANVAERFDAIPKRVGFFNDVPVFNIGGEEYRSVEELSNIIIDQLVKRGYSRRKLESLVNYEEKEVANVTNKRPDNTLAKRYLGHDPKITLEDGIERTINWMEYVYQSSIYLAGGKIAA